MSSPHQTKTMESEIDDFLAGGFFWAGVFVAEDCDGRWGVVFASSNSSKMWFGSSVVVEGRDLAVGFCVFTAEAEVGAVIAIFCWDEIVGGVCCSGVVCTSSAEGGVNVWVMEGI